MTHPNKIHVNLTDLQSTVFIPLYARSQETFQKGIINDPQALQMVRQIAYDFRVVRRDWAVLLCNIVRTEIVDRLTRDFIRRHPNATIINLGCGLCTRLTRVDNGKIRWFDIDLPPIISLKRHFITETDRYRFVSASIFDSKWITTIRETLGSAPILLIAEGLLFYLPKKEVAIFFKMVAKAFPHAEFIFECANQFLKLLSPFFSSMRNSSSRFKWAIHNLFSLKKWINVQILGEYFYYNQYKRRWKYFAAVNIFPWFFLRMIRIAHIKLLP